MKFLECTLWIVGVMLLLLFAAALGWQEIERRHEIAAFMGLQQTLATTTPRMKLPMQALQLPQAPELPEPNIPTAAPELAPVTAPEPANVAAQKRAHAALNRPDDVPIAILRIPAIGLVVPVNIGTGTSTLHRGAGLVAGSPLPGEIGNVAIAAHRDSFFRGLKDVTVSDTIELDTLGHTQHYRITKLTVVPPTDVGVLADVGKPVLTLITCYPFYFVGHAPKRFIVRAVATNFRR